jgi:chromosome segregation ATPase
VKDEPNAPNVLEHVDAPVVPPDAGRVPQVLVPRPAEPEGVVIERSTFEERAMFALEERLAEAEFRLRIQLERDQQQALEMRALERDLWLKDGYVAYLERDRGELHSRLLEVIAHRNDLQSALDHHQAVLADVQAQLGAIQQQLAYRAARKATRVLKENTGPLYGLLRAVLRAAAH